MAAKTVTWKPKAVEQYRILLEYLTETFSASTALKFSENVNAKISQIERYPDSGLATRFQTIRRVKIGKYNSIYYRLSGAKDYCSVYLGLKN